jgi:hypothetical protein
LWNSDVEIEGGGGEDFVRESGGEGVVCAGDYGNWVVVYCCGKSGGDEVLVYYARRGGGLGDEGRHEEFGEGGTVVDCAARLYNSSLVK